MTQVRWFRVTALSALVACSSSCSAAFGFYDLFRVEGGKLAEHWDSPRSVPSSTMSGLGIF